MKVYALVSQKGGVGKSTLTAHFAALAGEAGPAFIVDRDPQSTAGKWWERRTANEPAPDWPAALDVGGQDIEALAAELRLQPGALFLDTRPAVQEPEAAAARVADLVIVPVRPTLSNVEAIGDTLAMVRRVKRPAVIVVNAARNSGRGKEAVEALEGCGTPVCPIHLTDRTVYHDAENVGLTVMEMRGPAAEAAAAELRQVWDWIGGITK